MTHKITLLLLDLTKTYQHLYFRNKPAFYLKLRTAFTQKGYNLSTEKIRKKLSNMLTTYKRVKDRRRGTGEGKNAWEYYTVSVKPYCITRRLKFRHFHCALLFFPTANGRVIWLIRDWHCTTWDNLLHAVIFGRNILKQIHYTSRPTTPTRSRPAGWGWTSWNLSNAEHNQSYQQAEEANAILSVFGVVWSTCRKEDYCAWDTGEAWLGEMAATKGEA